MIVTRSSYRKIQLSEHRRKQTNPKLTNRMVMMRGSISMDFVEETARHSKILGMLKCHRGWIGVRTWLGCQLNLKVAFCRSYGPDMRVFSSMPHWRDNMKSAKRDEIDAQTTMWTVGDCT